MLKPVSWGLQRRIIITLLLSFLLLLLMCGSSCSREDQSQLLIQLGEMNNKIDNLMQENEELKKQMALQETKEEDNQEAIEESAAWYYIEMSQDGTGDVATLEEAVEKIEPGGTIYLNPGTYDLVTNLATDKTLRLIGNGLEETYIIYHRSPNIIEYTGKGLLTVSGISFKRDGSEWGDVIWIKSGQVHISDCSLSGATHFEKEEKGSVGGGMGILLWGDETSGIIQDCVISDNSVDGLHIRHNCRIDLIDNRISDNMQYGISYWDESTGTVRGNNCYENDDSGISLRDSSAAELIRNTCNNNEYAGIEYYGEMDSVAFQNLCYENNHGIAVGLQSQPRLLENICRDNFQIGIVYFENSSGYAVSNECNDNDYGIYIGKDAGPELFNNIFNNNNTDIEDNR